MSRAALSVLRYAGGSAVGVALTARATIDGSEGGTALAHAEGSASGPTVPRIPTLSIKRDTSSSAVPLRSLDEEALNQPLGRPQSLASWSFAQDKMTGHHFVQSKADPNERYQCPDGSNWVHGVAHPPPIREHNWDALKAEMLKGATSRPGGQFRSAKIPTTAPSLRV